MSDRPDIAVVVPARDAQATIAATLEALTAQAGAPPFEVVVVDNGSRDDTAAVAQRHGARVVRRERGEGPGAARNAGVAATAAPSLAFTDADCVPAPDWLARGAAALEDADLVCGRIVPERPPGPFDRSVSVERQTWLFETANLFARRPVFERAGGFPPGLEGAGAPFGEDALFGWAAVRAGARVEFEPACVVTHAVFARGPRAALAEVRRLELFPALVRELPELRGAFLRGRLFLTPRSARADLAIAGVALAALGRRPAPLALALPYARLVLGDARSAGRRAAAVRVAADAIGAAALVRGSLRARTPVL